VRARSNPSRLKYWIRPMPNGWTPEPLARQAELIHIMETMGAVHGA